MFALHETLTLLRSPGCISASICLVGVIVLGCGCPCCSVLNAVPVLGNHYSRGGGAEGGTPPLRFASLLTLPTIGCYALWSPFCSDNYIGAIGHSHATKTFLPVPRVFGLQTERWRDHALEIVRCLSSKPGSKVCKVYNLLKRIGFEAWVVPPIEECCAQDLFLTESFYIAHVKQPGWSVGQQQICVVSTLTPQPTDSLGLATCFA